jgi:hypothetical protein
MRICFDTETATHYAADGIQEPVCLTWAPEDDKSTGRIAVGDDAIDLWDAWVSDPSITLIAHNAPFDCAVLAKASALRAGTYTRPGAGPAYRRVFDLYRSGRILDTIPRQRLIDVATGRAGDDTRMGTLAKRLLHLDIGDDKKIPSEWAHLLGTPVQTWPTEAREATPWRFKYGLLQGVPLEHWPKDAKRYACEDPVIAWGIFDWQEKKARKVFKEHGGEIVNEREQARAAWDLHLFSLTGFATDRPHVQRLIRLYSEIEQVCSDLLVAHCALCGAPVIELPDPKTVKALQEQGAIPGDPRLGDCPTCHERVTLVREDITFRGGRKYRGEWQPERRERVKDRKAAQRLVWRVLGSHAPQTKTARERGLPRSEGTVGTDADTLVKVAAELADGRDGLLKEAAVLTAAEDGTLLDVIRATTLPIVNAVRLYGRSQKYQSAFLAPLDTDNRVRTSYQVCKDTGRTSCVAAWTPIDTPQGRIPIIDIKIGDTVWTHKKRWRRVTDTWLKGIAPMFDIELSSGEILTCTSAHRLLSSQGWIEVGTLYEHFQAMDRTAGEPRTGHGAIPIARLPDACGDSENARSDNSNDLAHSAPLHAAARAQGASDPALLHVQDGRQKPNEGQDRRSSPPLDRGVRRRLRLSDLPAQRQAPIRASGSHGGGVGVAGAAHTPGRAPYRLGSEKQQLGQSGAGDQTGTQNYSFPASEGLGQHCIQAIHYRGDFPVYDITVEDDESYAACGVFSHNSRKPNVQNFPRPNGLSSENTIRACIIADPGHSFLVCDYGQIELVGFAHVLNILGEMNGRGAGYQSSLARAINAGMDGHIMVAAEVLRKDYDTAIAAKESAKAKNGKGLTQLERDVARWRQVGKIQNYGAAGGMGAATFVAHASKQDAVISQRESEIVREAWLRAWSPDVPDYFKYFTKLTATSGRADITQLYSGRLRGKATFTQCCNTMFQALCADGAKYAMSLIVDACYLDPMSPLYGCTPVLFVHDEFVLSCPHGREKEAGAELSRLMIKGMARYIPDIKIEADCAVMARWGKG